MLHPAIISAGFLLSRVVLVGGALAMLFAFWRRR